VKRRLALAVTDLLVVAGCGGGPVLGGGRGETVGLTDPRNGGTPQGAELTRWSGTSRLITPPELPPPHSPHARY
jgi:hypothetical protein